LGTAASLDAGVPNGVATLDSGGKVPTSQIPQMGDLNYQGTWNASTNSPTLTSSTGTKGYYYVVNVAGTTNLDGITDWQVGDWAVFNGSTWQKIDNTDAVTSVNGYTGTVVLTYSDVGAANAPTNTNITSMTGVTSSISSPTFIHFDTTYATTLTTGQLGWDGNNTLGIGMAGGNVVQKIGEDQYFYCKATSTITKGQVVMFTGAVGASGVPTGAPATGITDGTYIMGIAAEAIATNGFGLIQTFGTLRNVNTSGYADGDILWYDPSVTGGLTKTKPSAPNVKVQMAAVINGGSSGGGTILIRIDPGSTLGGTDSNAQITSPANGNILTYDGTNDYWKNTDLAAGTGISISKSATGVLTVTNTAPSSGGTVTSVSGTAPIASTGGTTPTISITQSTTSTDGYLSSTDWNTFNGKQAAYTNLTSIGGLANASGWLKNNGSGTFSYSTPTYSDVGAPSTSGTGATGTWAISVSGNAATVTNGVYTTGSYSNPTWISSIASSKITGTIHADTVTNGVYVTDTGTVTNTMLAGNIANNKLANPSITLGSTSVSLGGTYTTIAGLTSVSSTTFTGNLTGNVAGNASTATKLAATKNINGVAFDGSADVTVTAAAGTLSGTTINSSVVTSSLTSVGTLNELSVEGELSVNNSIAATGDITTDSNVVVSTLPTTSAHATNKQYVDTRSIAMSIAMS
jgi:hypothetical protein